MSRISWTFDEQWRCLWGLFFYLLIFPLFPNGNRRPIFMKILQKSLPPHPSEDKRDEWSSLGKRSENKYSTIGGHYYDYNLLATDSSAVGTFNALSLRDPEGSTEVPCP